MFGMVFSIISFIISATIAVAILHFIMFLFICFFDRNEK